MSPGDKTHRRDTESVIETADRLHKIEAVITCMYACCHMLRFRNTVISGQQCLMLNVVSLLASICRPTLLQLFSMPAEM